MTTWARVTLEDGRRLTLRLTHESARMLVGIEVKADDDEVTKPGVDIVKHVIEKAAITKRVPLVMDLKYGTLKKGPTA